MNRLEAALRDAAADLDRHGLEWALVGGFAVSARTEPRFTRDVDVAVTVADDHAAEALVRALMANGYNLDAAREAVQLIAQRGYSRGRDLVAALDEFVS